MVDRRKMFSLISVFGVEELKDGSLGRILQKYLKQSFFVINLIEIYVQLQVISIKAFFSTFLAFCYFF